MGQTLKKRILIAPELVTAQAGIFFQNCGFELVTEFKTKADYEFIVDDYHSEVKTFPRLQIKKNIDPSCVEQVRAHIDEKILASTEGQALLSRYYADFNDFSLVDYFSNQYKNIYTLKVQDYLNIGYFVDTIVVEAYKNKFDHDKIRDYLNLSLKSALKNIERQDGPANLDVSFSYSDAGFAIQVSFDSSVTAFKKDLATLQEFSVHTNFYDLVYFGKRERVIFSSAWFKNPDLSAAMACFFTEVTAKKAEGDASAEVKPVEGPDQSVVYEPKKISSDQSKKLQVARKFSLFIKNYREKEESPKNVLMLEIRDVDDYLTKYPRQESVKELDDEIKNFIIKLLRDESLYQGVSDFVQKIAQNNLDSHVDDIQKVIGEKSLEDLTEILRVAGTKDESGDDKTTVGGWTENLNEEEWKVKRSELVEQIKEEVTVIKSQGRNIVQDDILRVMSDQLNANPEDMKTVVKGIVEEAVTSTIMQKEKLEEAFARTFVSSPTSSPANDAAKEKLEQQIARMKKLMEQMKNEIVKLKNENVVRLEKLTSTDNETDNAEVIELKRELEKAMETSKNKEKMAQKIKADMENVVQTKNEKIASLEMRIESIKNDFVQSAEFANEEKLEKLEVENKSLLARLELANRKINIISENMERQDSDANAKKEKEILTLKMNMQMAQSMIEKMKQDRTELESKLREEKEKYSKLKEEKADNGKEKNIEQEILISSLHSDKKSLEEKLKIQGIELKKIEQKLKYTSAQLEEAQKKKAGQAAAGNKSNEAYIKQLESANSRLAEASSDLVEKKKELHKYKQENAIMNAKLAELEKKLANLEKKAA